ncbi:hypothetical protein SADUNF_Sadunf02G0001900 [Salix dunnii]|uniref:Uncharacterized protein n=1 Tax=Salix dunnii TaxID=1413687 RepID=A0A835N5H8_9ROSI|nr:hypothetical protein SADUNF_Sadunf02G0001900 [Salix dunnii]
MAEHLASIFGTEKDRVNCPFYFKIGACRHGDRCSRLHNRPTISPTLLLSNMYQRPDMITPGVDAQGQPLDPHKIQEHFEEFYEDIFEELNKFGEIESLNVCDNLADHMIGNVYVQFKEEDQAAAALQALQGRFYSGRPIIADFSPVTDFREATCRQFEENNCNRGGYCVRGITGTETGIETETVIIEEMGGGMTSMTETEEEKNMGVQLGRAVRNEGLGSSNGIERGRRRSNLKMESVVLVGLRVEMYPGIFLLLVTIPGSDVWLGSVLDHIIGSVEHEIGPKKVMVSVSKASIAQASLMKQHLDEFCNLSSQKFFRSLYGSYGDEDARAQIEKTGSTEHAVVYLHWKPSKPDDCKVNTDKSRINTTGFSGVGGVLRLSLAWDYGYQDMEIKYDSGATATLLIFIMVSAHSLYNIILCCKMKIHDHWCCTIKHIYCEQNIATDALATRSYNLGFDLHVYEEAPDFLTIFLLRILGVL